MARRTLPHLPATDPDEILFTPEGKTIVNPRNMTIAGRF